MSMIRLFLLYSVVLLVVGTILLVITDNGTMNTDDIHNDKLYDDINSDYFDNSFVRAVLDRHFAGLSGGSVFPLMTRPGSGTILCASINYDDTYDNIRTNIRSQLGLDNYCGPNGSYEHDMTCKALNAAESSMGELSSLAIKKNKGPRFYNAAVVDFVPKDVSGVSSCKKGSMSQVILSNATVVADYVNPSAILQKKNGCNLYSLCDIVASVLTNTSDQAQTETCGPTAIYTWLMMKDPTRALKYVIELFWTSGVNEKDGVVNTCPVYFAAQPGLIPFNSTVYGFPTAMKKRQSNSPYTQPGLQHMATTALVSEYYKYLKNEVPDKDSCPKMSDPVLENVVMDDATVADVGNRTGNVSVGSVMHWCKKIVFNYMKGDCEMLNNPEVASRIFPDISPEDALNALSTVIMLSNKYAGEETAIAIQKMKANPNLSFSKLFQYSSSSAVIAVEGTAIHVDDLLTMVPNIFANPQSPEYKRFDNLLNASAALVNFPNFDNANVAKMCARGGGILRVASSALPGHSIPRENPLTLAQIQPFNHNCDHFILLQQCDSYADVYQLWTWGFSAWVRKEVLLAIVCNAVIPPQN